MRLSPRFELKEKRESIFLRALPTFWEDWLRTLVVVVRFVEDLRKVG